MTIDALIDTILAGATGEAAYAAYDQASRAAANERGQVLDVRANAVLDVIKRDILSPWARGLTDGGRSILEGLRTKEPAPAAVPQGETGPLPANGYRIASPAEQARTVILDSAPALIAAMPAGLARTACETLYATAQSRPPLSAFATAQLAGYARTMHREPPTRRTLRGLLTWLVPDEETV